MSGNSHIRHRSPSAAGKALQASFAEQVKDAVARAELAGAPVATLPPKGEKRSSIKRTAKKTARKFVSSAKATRVRTKVTSRKSSK